MYEQFSERAKKVIQLSEREVRHYKSGNIRPEELCLGILIEGTGVACNAINNLHVPISELLKEVRSVTTSGSVPASVPVGFTQEVYEILNVRIAQEASALGHNYQGTEHMFLALLKTKLSEALRKVLDGRGITYEAILAEIRRLLGHDDEEVASQELLNPDRPFERFSLDDGAKLYQLFVRAFQNKNIRQKEASGIVEVLVGSVHFLETMEQAVETVAVSLRSLGAFDSPPAAPQEKID